MQPTLNFKLIYKLAPDQAPECNDQPSPLEVQPCELAKHKQKPVDVTNTGVKI